MRCDAMLLSVFQGWHMDDVIIASSIVEKSNNKKKYFQQFMAIFCVFFNISLKRPLLFYWLFHFS